MSQSIVDMQNALRFDSLSWVNDELRQLLVDVQRELEGISRSDNSSDVKQAISILEQLTGTLSLIEVKGASLLSKEMTELLLAYADNQVEKKELALELLISSALRIEDYLDYLSSGNQDIPALLLPIINDLREVRNAELMSDKVIFMPDFQSAMDTIEIQALDSGDIQAIAKKRRVAYQVGLLDLLKNENQALACSRMQAVLDILYKSSKERLTANMWWIGTALIEVVGEVAAEDKMQLMAILGQLDRHIKVLVDQGEDGLQKVISFELIKNMLYYLAKSQLNSEKVIQAKTIFKLDDYLIKDLRGETSSWLGPPNKQLIDTVSKALHEDVNAVKDVIDVYSHSDRSDVGSLQQASQHLQKIGDTLTMLGLGATKDRIMNEKAMLDQHLLEDKAMDDESLMLIAAVLLTIEEDLQAYRDNRETLSEVRTNAANDSNDDTSVIAENRKVTSTLANEALRDLSWVKDVYLDYLQSDQQIDLLTRVPKVLRSIAGAMFVEPLSGIVTSVNELKDYVENVLIAKAHTPQEREQNVFAEVITNIECFLEAIIENRLDAELFIDAANLALDELESLSPAVVADDASGQINDIKNDLEDLAGDMQIEVPIVEMPTLDSDTNAQLQSAGSEKKSAYGDLQIVASDADEEIIEIFIEEAEEEVQRISEMYPQWQSNPDNNKAVTVVRRSFHTLKGSGRIVGAQLIGEFAWKFENLLNRIIDGTIEPHSNVFNAIADTLPLLPKLIEQIRNNDNTPLPEVYQLMETAEHLSSTQGVGNPDTDTSMVSVDTSANVPVTPAEPAIDEVEVVEMAEAEPVEEAIELQEDIALDSIEDEISLESSEDSSFLVDEDDASLSAGELLLDELDDNVEAIDALVESEPQLDDISTELPSIEETEIESAAHTLPNEAGEAIDTELIRIFSDEVSSHLKTIETFITESHQSTVPLHGDEPLYRAFHTIHGSAKTSPTFYKIAELSESLEQLFNGFKSLGMPWSDDDLSLLEKSLGFIRNSLSALAQNISDYPDSDQVILKANARYNEIKAKLTAQYKVLTETQAYEVDDELVDVFMEEGEELLDVLDRSVHNAVSKDAIDIHLPEILRVLHTLKGSARMANLASIGDLSHHLESVFVEIAENKLSFDDKAKSVIQKSTDSLSHMVHMLRQSQTPADPTALIEELNQVLHAKESVQNETPADATTVSSDIELLAEQQGLSTEDNKQPAANVAAQEEQKPKQDEDVVVNTPAPTPVAKELFAEHKDSQDEALPAAAQRQDLVRVQASRLENLVNFAGEVNIFQSRLGQYINDISNNLLEVDNTLDRLRNQLRNMELETEAQIASRKEREREDPNIDFDPLEMDRYSNMQHLTRAISESADDLMNIRSTLSELLRESEAAVLQQSRVTTDLQDGLLKTQMVSFQGLVSRLRRLVRQTAQQLHKKVEISIKGFDTEIDRSVQVALVSSIEHMLRNAIYHGIEMPADRLKQGKPETGRITMEVRRDGSYIVIQISDDGMGIDPTIIRNKAIAAGIIKPDQNIQHKDILQLILHSGFSTADEVSQIAGRGVGMDVVSNQIKELGGSLQIDSSVGIGTSFAVRLPQTLSISNGLMLELGDTPYVVLLSAITGIVTISGEKMQDHIRGDFTAYEYGNEIYPVHYLGSLLDTPVPESFKNKDIQIPIVFDSRRG